MTTKDKDKLVQNYRRLPITKLICITSESHTDEEVEVAGEIIIKRQKYVISFFQKMKAFELFLNIASPDFSKYNAVAFVAIKQVFSERKEDMLPILNTMDEIHRVVKGELREIEEALRQNVQYLSKKQTHEYRHQKMLDEIERFKPAKIGWFAKRMVKHMEHKIEKAKIEPPKKLDKDSRRFLEEQAIEKKEKIATWNGKIRPMILELLKVV